MVAVDPVAERACLGALLHFPEYLPTKAAWLTSAMFTEPRNIVVMEAIEQAAHTEQIPDVVTVMEILRASGAVGRDHGLLVYVTELKNADNCPWPMNLEYYATLVARAWRLNEIDKVVTRMHTAISTAEPEDLATHLPDLTEAIARLTQPIDDRDTPIPGFYEWSEFEAEMAGRGPEEWVVPGLIARQDRVIVVANEGAGKSMVARAVAVGIAAGRHPLDPTVPIPARRTLLVDLENPDRIIHTKTGMFTGFMRSRNLWTDGMLHLLKHPGGLDLRRPAEARILERAVQRCNPAIVCLGPIYKTFAAVHGEREEQAAREVALFLDSLREKYGCAFWLEHHAPMDQGGHRNMRPVNTGLWLRWPEFGLALVPDEEDTTNPDALHVKYWRGGRDEREWPSVFARETMTGWPWRVSWEGGQPAWMLRARTAESDSRRLFPGENDA